MSLVTNANVRSLDALRDVRLALIKFQESASSALGSLRSKIDRTKAWLEQDRPLYWAEQERRAYDGVASARVGYETCKLRTVAGRHPECIEEKIALQRAKARLEYCQQKVVAVRRWVIEVGRQSDDYRGRVGPLQRLIEEDIPNVLARVSRMIDALEAYAEVGPVSDSSAAAISQPVSLSSLPVSQGTEVDESAK
jgi:hypothetical protein